MKHIAVLVASGLIAMTFPGPVSGGQLAVVHSEARLVSDVSSIRPGVPFVVGLHISLDEGWRTPWKNAGDVGNAMLATWTLPQGFSVDSLAYPIPQRIVTPPAASYGYVNEVVIMATVTPPADLEAGRSVRLGLSADYVLCGHTCIPVNVERSLELRVGDTQQASSDDAELIRSYASRLPAVHAQWTTHAARTSGGFVLSVTPPADWNGSLGGAYFFPFDAALLDHAADQPVERTPEGQYQIRLTRSAYLAGEPERIDGILVLPEGSALDAAGRRGLIVNTTLARK